MKIKVGVIFGGKSAEHDVSIVSAYHILQEIYYEYYQVVPVYITPNGEWLKGSLINNVDEVPSLSELREHSREKFDFNEFNGESIAFPVLHGPNGEDGTVQGLFEVLNVPYVGSGVLASAAGMDKIVSKILFENAQVPALVSQLLFIFCPGK